MSRGAIFLLNVLALAIIAVACAFTVHWHSSGNARKSATYKLLSTPSIRQPAIRSANLAALKKLSDHVESQSQYTITSAIILQGSGLTSLGAHWLSAVNAPLVTNIYIKGQVNQKFELSAEDLRNNGISLAVHAYQSAMHRISTAEYVEEPAIVELYVKDRLVASELVNVLIDDLRKSDG